MALPCIQLCQRCSRVLRSKRLSVTLQYSTQVHHYPPPAFRTSTKIPMGSSSSIIWNNTTSCLRQRWKQGVCYYSDFVAKPIQEKEHTDGQELSGTEVVVPHNNLLSQQQIRDATSMTDSQTALDLDAVPRLSALDIITDEEAVGISVPSLTVPPASFSLRDYVDESETLSKLVQLGVNLWELEQRPNVGSMLLRLDFQTDVAPRLLFLKEIGVEDSDLGYILSHNPFILTESLEHLQARVKYLRTMKFSSENIASMVSRAPYLLNFSVQRLDNRLGFYQKELGLSTQKTRIVVARLPRLLCGSLEPVKENLKVCKMEFGFKDNELQHIITIVPKVLTANKRKLTQIFDYIHNTMKVPRHMIVKFPQVFNTRYLRIRERHLFLQYLGKAQYDPAQPAYISLERLASLPDDVFCTELASATLEDFELFQKTL